MKLKIFLCGLILALLLTASLVGVAFGTQGSHNVAFKTFRGEDAQMQMGGFYAFNPAQLSFEGVVWDWVNLVVAAPLFLAAVILTARGQLRGRLMLGGLLAYCFYTFLMYATMWAFNPLLLVYTAIFSLSGIAFFMNLQDINVADLPKHVSKRFPRKLFAGFFLLMSTMLILMWGKLIFTSLADNKLSGALAGLPTLQTQAMDLGMVVPLGICAAVMLLRRSPKGYLLAGIYMAFGLMMSITIPAWVLTSIFQSVQVNLAEGIPFMLMCLAGVGLAVTYFLNIQDTAPTP